MTTKPDQTPSIDSVFRPVVDALARLVRQLRNGLGTNGDDVEDLRYLLETLPLSSEEFGLACNRLRNAQRYLQANEGGAAKWELNALKQHLRATVEAQGAEPQHRQRR